MSCVLAPPGPAFARWLREPQARLAVVGASGWVGSAVVAMALAAGAEPSTLRLFGSREAMLALGGRSLPVRMLAGADLGVRAEVQDWTVVHAAVVGADRVPQGEAAELRARNDRLLADVFALVEATGARRLALVSSGAAGRGDAGEGPRAAYARLKREHEAAATAFAARCGVGLLIPRVFNLGGPYINHVDAYALGDFLLAGAREGAIRIAAGVPVVRSYVHVLEFAATLLDATTDPQAPDGPFDVAGAQAVELAAVAACAARALGSPKLRVESAPPSGAAADRYVGDPRIWSALLARYGRAPAGLERIVADTAAFLRAQGRLGAVS